MTVQPRLKTDQDLYPEILYSGQNLHHVFKMLWPDGESVPLPLEPSLKLRDHSPTGFSWGYNGSGPAQLALALLLDATSDPDKACQFYQEFKWAMVAGFSKEWAMLRSEILNWVLLAENQDLREKQAKN